MCHAADAAVRVILGYSTETAPLGFYPEHAPGRNATGTPVRRRRRHRVGEGLNPRYGILGKTDGERLVLQTQRFDQIFGQVLIFILRHSGFLLLWGWRNCENCRSLGPYGSPLTANVPA
jgi:hypothetical protein